MLVKDFAKYMVYGDLTIYEILYTDKDGQIISIESDFPEILTDIFGDYNLEETEAIWIGIKDDCPILQLYVYKNE